MPGTYFGPHREQYSDYAHSGNANLGRYPLGHTLILPDDREYRFTLNDGTVEVAGNLYQSVVGLAGHTNRGADVARAIGATAIGGNITTTVAAADIYAEGTAHTNNDTGAGYSYRIRRAMTAGAAHASAASTAALTVNLDVGESVQVAIDTTTEVTFTRNRYHAALITAAPPTAPLTGVSPGVAAADRFYWSQVKGYAAVQAQIGTLYAGLPVQAGITTGGRIESYKRRVRTGGTTVIFLSNTAIWGAPLSDSDGSDVVVYAIASVISAAAAATYDISAGIAYNAPIVGMCVKANASTEFALIDLNIT